MIIARATEQGVENKELERQRIAQEEEFCWLEREKSFSDDPSIWLLLERYQIENRKPRV